MEKLGIQRKEGKRARVSQPPLPAQESTEGPASPHCRAGRGCGGTTEVHGAGNFCARSQVQALGLWLGFGTGCGEGTEACAKGLLFRKTAVFIFSLISLLHTGLPGLHINTATAATPAQPLWDFPSHSEGSQRPSGPTGPTGCTLHQPHHISVTASRKSSLPLQIDLCPPCSEP